MRLTLTHLRRAPQFTNVLLQREVDLRGLGLSSLDENALVMLNNEFDVVNLTSNALTALEYFPTADANSHKGGCMDRVTTLIVHRNQIQKVSTVSCALALPNVTHFLADRNNFRAARDVLFLRHWKKLEIVSLEDNPLWDSNPEGFDASTLRAFLVYLCPSLKLINYARVLQSDRDRTESLRKEFKALVSQWDGAALTLGSADGKRIRKRGRANRAANNGNHPTDTSAHAALTKESTNEGNADTGATEEEAALAAAHTATATAVAAEEGREKDAEGDRVQARLDEIERRILSEDITSEEIVALEQEMNELMAEQERRKKRRK